MRWKEREGSLCLVVDCKRHFIEGLRDWGAERRKKCSGWASSMMEELYGEAKVDLFASCVDIISLLCLLKTKIRTISCGLVRSVQIQMQNINIPNPKPASHCISLTNMPTPPPYLISNTICRLSIDSRGGSAPVHQSDVMF